MRGVPFKRGLQEPGKSPTFPRRQSSSLTAWETRPPQPTSQQGCDQSRGADPALSSDLGSRCVLSGAGGGGEGSGGLLMEGRQFFPLQGAGLFARCPRHQVLSGWWRGKVKPVRTCLEARGPICRVLLTLWFQRYFRKKRSLQRNILKKYEPVTHYLSVFILILSVEGEFSDSTAILSRSNHEAFAQSFLFP